MNFSLSELEKQREVVPTLNKMGHSFKELTYYTQSFIQYAATCSLPVLDIGAAYGVATLPALAAGATVIANDINSEHLKILKKNTSKIYHERLTVLCGKIPGKIRFNSQSLGAIHLSQVMHFLTGQEINILVKQMFQWLFPGGKIYIIASTPYIMSLEGFLEEYSKRLQKGDLWPGFIDDISCYFSYEYAQNLPKYMNFLDIPVLKRVLKESGFNIDVIELFDRSALIAEHIKLDGRENIGVIATKPML